jgi:hypothetical protein
MQNGRTLKAWFEKVRPKIQVNLLSKRLIRLRFQNGLDFETFKKEVFDIENLTELYQFDESADPDFVIFGPYGDDIPSKGNYIRIGYFCENIKPDFSNCEWAFGVPREEDVQHPNYKRIQWHGLDPKLLIKSQNNSPEQILASKTKFCNFLYSHSVPYREAFFKQLSKYKKVDAPGISMNNMPGIDTLYEGDRWEIKRQFLSPYKFTIAFENDVFPGYQTEKLYDAMLAGSIPIYCGDPFIGEIFNKKAFINAWDFIDPRTAFSRWLEKNSQNDFVDIRPQFYHNPLHRVKRKLKAIGRDMKMNLLFGNLDFSGLIEYVIQLDQCAERYMEMIQQPWLNDNNVPQYSSAKERWIEIFNKIK